MKISDNLKPEGDHCFFYLRMPGTNVPVGAVALERVPGTTAFKVAGSLCHEGDPWDRRTAVHKALVG